MNLQNLLLHTNYWYENAFETEHARKPVFLEILNELDNQPADILEIGTTGGDINDPNGIHGSGHSTFYFAEYVRQHGGLLTIVDMDPQIIENAKIMLEDFIKVGVNIKFECDDGMNCVGRKYDLYYLDGSDLEWQTYEMFRKIDLSKGSVLLDDWNENGKCSRIKMFYPFFSKVWICGTTHQMGYYKKMDNYGNEKFKIEDLELPYYRGWKGNREASNERSLEVGLGRWFIEKFNGDITELGAVTPYYSEWFNYELKHRIVDPYDAYELCIRDDGEEYNYTGQNVLSISSLEHFANDDGYDKHKDGQKAIRTLEKITKTAKNYMLMWGVGQHSELDKYIQESNLPIKIMVRENKRGLVNNWIENNDKNNLYMTYGDWNLNCDLYGNSICEVIVSNLL